jgi:hypothetical protein
MRDDVGWHKRMRDDDVRIEYYEIITEEGIE